MVRWSPLHESPDAHSGRAHAIVLQFYSLERSVKWAVPLVISPEVKRPRVFTNKGQHRLFDVNSLFKFVERLVKIVEI